MRICASCASGLDAHPPVSRANPTARAQPLLAVAHPQCLTRHDTYMRKHPDRRHPHPIRRLCASMVKARLIHVPKRVRDRTTLPAQCRWLALSFKISRRRRRPSFGEKPAESSFPFSERSLPSHIRPSERRSRRVEFHVYRTSFNIIRLVREQKDLSGRRPPETTTGALGNYGSRWSGPRGHGDLGPRRNLSCGLLFVRCLRGDLSRWRHRPPQGRRRSRMTLHLRGRRAPR